MDYSNEAKFLRERRKKLKLTQKDLANKIGIKHDQFICNIERASAGIPVERLKSFATALELDFDTLIKLKTKTYQNWLRSL